MEMLQGDKFPAEITQSNLEEFLSKEPKFPKITTKIHDTTPVKEFLSGKNCLTGVRNHFQLSQRILSELFFTSRALAGGSTNFATVDMFDNFTSIKVVRRQSYLDFSMKHCTKSGWTKTNRKNRNRHAPICPISIRVAICVKRLVKSVKPKSN